MLPKWPLFLLLLRSRLGWGFGVFWWWFSLCVYGLFNWVVGGGGYCFLGGWMLVVVVLGRFFCGVVCFF